MKSQIFILLFFSSLFFETTQCQSKIINIENSIQIELPKKFIELDLQIIDSIYKDSLYKPFKIFMVEADSVQFIVTKNSSLTSNELIELTRNFYVDNFKEIYPNAKWISTKTEIINRLTVGYFETTDNITYNLIFFTSINGKGLHFGFQSKVSDFAKYQNIARSILNSIHPLN